MRFRAAALLAALALVPTCAKHLNSFAFVGTAVVAFVSGGNVGGSGRNSDMEEMNAYTTISLKNPTVATIARRRVGRGGGGGDDTMDDNDDDNDGKDHNSNTTIKQCTGERGADDDGGDRQLGLATLTMIDGDGDRP